MTKKLHDVVHIRKDHMGLGDRIAGLMGAIDYAHTTGRRLVVLWQGATYTRVHEDVNGFPVSFESTGRLGDVELFAPDRKDQPTWKTALDVADNHPELCRAILNGEDVETEAVIFRHPFSAGMFCCRECKREPLARLKPSEPVRVMMDAFLEKHFTGKPVIGLAIRHGNGEPLRGGREYDDEALVDKAVHAVGRARKAMGQDCPVFVAADNWKTIKAFHNYIEGSFNLNKFVPAENQGALHHRHPEPAAGFTGHELPAEIMLLAHCKGLVYNPSFRPDYGRIMADLDYEECIFDQGVWPWDEKASRDYFVEVSKLEAPLKGTTRCGCQNS